MEDLKPKTLANEKQFAGGWYHFPFFYEMRSALKRSNDNVKDSKDKLKALSKNYPKYFSGETKYLCKEHSSGSSGNHKKTQKMLDDIKQQIFEIVDNASRYQYCIRNLLLDIESLCEDSISLSVKLNNVTVLHQEDQRQKDVITTLILNLNNVYSSLLTPEARTDIIDYLNELILAQSNAFAYLEFGAYCARTYLVGHSSVQIVSDGIQEVTDNYCLSQM